MFWEANDEMKHEEYTKALAWVMTTFLWYSEYLETGEQSWKKKSK
jgi:hypothetical protein